jgi:hypothetical protein
VGAESAKIELKLLRVEGLCEMEKPSLDATWVEGTDAMKYFYRPSRRLWFRGTPGSGVQIHLARTSIEYPPNIREVSLVLNFDKGMRIKLAMRPRSVWFGIEIARSVKIQSTT